jgi:Domain of unknown function (DUF4281)
MTFLSSAFRLATWLSLLGWIVLLGFPLWPAQGRTIVLGISVGLLCALYCYLIVAGRRHDVPGEAPRGHFFSLQGVIRLFKSPRVVLAGWVHFLAFDLMVGLYIVTDAARHGMSHWLLIPVLLLTLMFGPAGLLVYLLLRVALTGDGVLIDAA